MKASRSQYTTVHVAKTTLSKLIARVLSGEEIVIARGADPVVKLVPFERTQSKRKFGALKGKVSVPKSFFDHLPKSELDEWEG